MTQIKGTAAKEYVAKFWYEQPNKQALQMAYMAGFTEASKRHEKELQILKDKAMEAFESTFDLPQEMEVYEFLKKEFIQKLNEQ